MRSQIIRRAAWAAVLGVSVFGQIADAQTIIRSNAVASLNDPAAWTGGVVPGAANVATWNSGSAGGAQTLGGSLSWGGVVVSGGTPSTPVISDTGGAVLTLGGLGIDLGNNNLATNRGLTLNVGTTLNDPILVKLGNQNGASLTFGANTAGSPTGLVTGAGGFSLEASTFPGSGTTLAQGALILNNGGNTFSGGVAMGPSTILTVGTNSANPIFAAGALTSSALGTGPLTINGGRLNANNKNIYNPAISLGGDFVLATSNRIDLAGTIDLAGSLAGQTRTVALTRAVTPANVLVGGGNNSLRLTHTPGSGTPLTNVNVDTVVRNGNLRFTADPSVAATSFVTVNLGGGLARTSFENNSGLVVGDRVVVTFASSFVFNPLATPALTVQPGGRFILSDAQGASRNISVHSLSGGGLVSNLATNANGNTSLASTLTINSRTNALTSAEFTGVISDNDNAAFGGAATAGAIVSVVKSGDGLQALSGNNTYTGSTLVAAGVLAVPSINGVGVSGPIGASSGVTSGLILSGGTLRSTGSGGSTDRLFTVRATGGSIESSGTGGIDFSSTAAIVVEDPSDRPSTGTAGLSTLNLPALDLVAGMTISGDHIAPGTTIVAVDRYAGSVTLSQPLTANAANLNTVIGTAARSLTLGGSNADANTLRASLGDSPASAALGVTKSGAGTWVITGTNTYSGPTQVNAGTLAVGSTTAVPASSLVTVASGATLSFNTPRSTAIELENGNLSRAAGSTVDLKAGALVLDYEAVSPLSVVVADIATAFANGTFTGTGITTSSSDAGRKLQIGYAEAADLVGAGGGSWRSVSVDGTAILLVATLAGDTNLDGLVGFPDLLALARSYNQSGSWIQGDFNYDGTVGFSDLLALARSYNASLAEGSPTGDFASDWALAQSMVPEPATLGVIIGLGGCILSRGRRRSGR